MVEGRSKAAFKTWLADRDDALAQAFSGAAGEAQLVLVRRDGTTSAVLTLLSRQP